MICLEIRYFYEVQKQHLILAVAWILFCVLHSILASGSVKRWVSLHYPRLRKYYRLFYTLFAALTFIPVTIYEINLPSPFLLSKIYLWPGIIAGIAGALIMLVCIKKYFIGLTGLKALFTNQPFRAELEISGIHKFVRHPLYLGTFLFIWGLFFIIPHLSLLISNIVITVYTLTGIRFEEEKLVAEFGDTYKTYQKDVPKIIPKLKV
jgi:methanethiol S-methyltransferase